LRKILNYGHTIGHALESFYLNTSLPISHGQAVTLGMLAEAKISNQLGMLNNIDFNSIVNAIFRLLDPVRISLPTFASLLPLISMDKKKKGERVGFSLPGRIGSCSWDIPVEPAVVEDSFEWLVQVLQSERRLNIRD